MKVGDKIKLKDYSLYCDYADHRGEVATIKTINSTNNIYIAWKDKSTSTIFNQSNIILYEEVKNWKERLRR